MYLCLYVYMSEWLCVCVRVNLYACIHACMYISMYVQPVSLYVHVICVRACVCAENTFIFPHNKCIKLLNSF